MNLEKLQETTAKLARLAADAEGLQKRYTAHLMLYDAACMAANIEEIAQRAEQCHTLLDSILDNTRSVHFLTREVHKLLPQ